MLKAWDGDESPFDGRYFQLPPVRIWPLPIRRPDQILLHATNSPESMRSSIAAGCRR